MKGERSRDLKPFLVFLLFSFLLETSSPILHLLQDRHTH